MFIGYLSGLGRVTCAKGGNMMKILLAALILVLGGNGLAYADAIGDEEYHDFQRAYLLLRDKTGISLEEFRQHYDAFKGENGWIAYENLMIIKQTIELEQKKKIGLLLAKVMFGCFVASGLLAICCAFRKHWEEVLGFTALSFTMLIATGMICTGF